MKTNWKTLKRFLAMVMSLVMVFSCVQMGIPTHVHAVESEPKKPGVTLGEIIAGNYELSEVEKEVLESGDLSAQINFEYNYELPPAETVEEDGLVSVDRENKVISVQNYKDTEGNTWTAKSVTIKVNEQAVETVTLTNGSGTYTYDGNAFAVVVEYVLTAGGLLEDITEVQQLALLNAVIYLAEDVDYLQILKEDVFVSELGFELTPNSFLDVMTLDIPQLGGVPIDLMYSLVEGIEKTVQLPDSDPVVISIKLEGDAAAAAESLKAQKEQNGQLDLPYFFKTHDCSYLELLYNAGYRAGLEEALNQNLKDIDDLLDGGTGLRKIRNKMQELKEETIPELKDTVYGLMNDNYAAIRNVLGGPVPGVSGRVDKPEEITAIRNAVEQFYADSLKDANDLLNDKVASGELDAEWVPENGIQSAADLKALLDTVQKVYDDGLAEINAQLETYGAELGITLPVVKESMHVDYVKDEIDEFVSGKIDDLNKTVEQYNNAYNLNLPKVAYTGLDNLEETSEDVQELQTAVATAKEQLNNMLNNANQTLDNLGYEGADVTKAEDIDAVILPWQNGLYDENWKLGQALQAAKTLLKDSGYTGDITDADDIDAAIKFLSENAGNELAQATALVAEKQAKRDAVLKDINTLMGRYGYSKTVTASTDVNAAIRHFNGKPSAAEKYVWGRVNEGLNGLITINSVDQVESAKASAKALYESGLYPELTKELYDKFVESVDEAAERVNNIPTAKSTMSDVYKPALQTAEQELKDAQAALEELDDPSATLIPALYAEKDKVVAAQAQIDTYNANIASAESVREQLETIAPALEGVAEAEQLLDTLQGHLAAAPDMVDQLNEGKALMEKAEDALELLKEKYDQMVEAEEKIDLLRQADDGMAELAAYEEQLDQYVNYLPILIGIFDSFIDTVQPVSDRFFDAEWDPWKVTEYAKSDADFDMLTEAAVAMEGTPFYTKADLKSPEELYITSGTTQFNMSMYNVTVIYKAAIVNPLLVDSDELYDLIPTQQTITLEAGATAEQIMAAIQALNAEDAALKSWADYKINTENYDRTETELPETLEKNENYVVTYVPKTLNVSYRGMTGPATVLYGHRMSLPVCETEGKEYTYKVNGALQYEGSIVTLTKDTNIVCTEGDKSTDSSLLDLVVNATSVNDMVKKILSSAAVSYNETVKIRFPSAALLSVDTDNKILTASKYENAIGTKAWIALNAVTKDANSNILENLNAFVNDQAAYEEDFAIADVLYQIAFTASDANTTDAKILAAMNFANVLADEYADQKAALEYLTSESFMNALAMLDMNDEQVGTALNGAATLLANDPAAPALNTIINDLNSNDNKKLTLYNLLFNYKEQGMVYYYKNDAAIRNELTKMQNAMSVLTSSSKFMGLVRENSPSLHDRLLDLKSDLLATAIPAKNAKIVITNDAALKQLIADIDAYAQVGTTTYNTVGEMKWTTTLSATVGVKIITIHVKYGAQVGTLKLNFTEGNALDAEDIQSMLDQLAALEAEMGVDKDHFVRSGDLPKIGDVMDENLSEADLTYNVSWDAKSYGIIVDGNEVGSVTYEDPYFALPSHGDSEYRYDYVIGGKTYTQGDIVNLKADFDNLFATGTLTIIRKEVDKVREQLVKFVDSMKGAITLVEHGNRQYSLVLKVNPATVTADMSNFAMGMLMSGYGYIGMDGKMFYGTTEEDTVPQFHLQTMVDMIMNSGMGTQTIIDLYGAKGFNNIALNGEIISANGGNIKTLGGKLLQSTMSFGSSAEDDLEVGFYITMADNATVKKLSSAIASAQGYVSIALQNGQIEASVNLPDQVYAAYLAALSVVGEADVHSIEEMNAEIALGYLFTLIDPILDDENVTTETFENTLAMFGKTVDLSKYASAYAKMQSLYGTLLTDRTYTDAGCTITIDNFSINVLIDWVQKNVIAKLAAGFGVGPNDIQLSGMIYEYKTDASDEDYGLDLKLYAELANLNKDYAALFIAPQAGGITNKLGMLTAQEVAAGALANVQGISYVILLNDIEGDLVFNGKTLLDLNGKTINGNLAANASVIVVDNAYQAKVAGGVTGKISGNVTILDGKYASNVSAFIPEGYEQLSNGTVCNKMFTITSDGENNITVTVHTNLSSIRELASKQGVINLGLNIAVELALNHYDTAALAIGPEDGELLKVFDARFDDIFGLLTGGNLLTNGLNTILAGTSMSDLADLFNVVIGDLTDFAALSEALAGDGKVATYKTQTAAWQLDVEHMADGDYLTLSLGSNDEKKDGTLSLVIDGALTEELQILLAAMAETVKVESELDLNDLMIDENGLMDVIGSYKGTIEIDFTGDRNYVIMLAVNLAHGNASIRKDMVDAIKTYYASGETSLVELEECFKKLSADAITDALANHNRAKNFTQMVKELGLSGIVDSEIGNDEMGYAKLIDVLGIALRELKERDLLESILGSSRTLGSFEKTDAKGNYFGFSTSRAFDKVFGPFRGYSVGVNMDLSELSVKVRMFAEEALVIVTDGTGERIGTFDNLEEAFALANNNPGSTVTVTGGVTLNNDLVVNTQIKLVGIKRITFADGVKILLNSENAELTADKAINDYVAVADGAAYCLKVETNGNFTVYAARAHFDSATDNDHLCDYGCGTVVEGCSDAAGDGDHACDVCGEIIEECFDNNNDHNCDECGAVVSSCVDEDANGFCDICGKDLDPTCEHVDNDNDHKCDDCGEVISTCADNNSDHKCDICGAVLSQCADNDRNHKCDICGAVLSQCADNDNDHKCDICGAVLSQCADNDNDHKCDLCGAVLSQCADNDNDHKCDLCGETLSECVDDNRDHNCDICGEVLSDHMDDDKDHNCDWCGEENISTCADNNKDHKCDICGAVLSQCADNDKDHKCDLCGAVLSQCADDDKDHKCDLCGETLSECSDAPNDGDHACDICGKDGITDCVDSNNDKYCDDCGAVLSKPTVGKPVVSQSEKLFGSLVDTDNKIIYLDTYREGIKVEELAALLAGTIVEYDADGKVTVTVVNKNGTKLTGTDLVPTAAKITLTATNAVGEATAVYSIVVIGDTNCNGKIESQDAVIISSYYLGKKKLEGLELDAADTNRNGKIENNDAVLISVKFLRPVNYTSRLKAD